MGSRMTLWMAEGGTVFNRQMSAIYSPSWFNLPPPITPYSQPTERGSLGHYRGFTYVYNSLMLPYPHIELSQEELWVKFRTRL